MKFLIFLLLAAVSNSAFAEPLEPENLVIESFKCVGNEKTDCDVILREIYLKAGEKIDEEEIENAKTRLLLLGIFKDVDIRIEKGSAVGQVNLIAEVEEDSALFFEFQDSVEIDSLMVDGSNPSTKRSDEVVDDLFHPSSPKLTIGNRNLFGKGKTLKASVQTNDFPRPSKTFSDKISHLEVGLDYIDPHLFGNQDYFLKLKAAQIYLRDDFYNKDLEKRSELYQLDLGRRLFDFSYFSIGLQHSAHYPNDSNYRGFANYYQLNYGWNSIDDEHFGTTGSSFNFSSSSILSTPYDNKPEIEPQYLSGSYKQLLQLDSNEVLTLDLGHSTHLKGLFYSTRATLEYAVLLRKGIQDSEVSDLKVFFKPIYTSIENNKDYMELQSGLVMDLKHFGIVNLTATYRGEQ